MTDRCVGQISWVFPGGGGNVHLDRMCPRDLAERRVGRVGGRIVVRLPAQVGLSLSNRDEGPGKTQVLVPLRVLGPCARGRLPRDADTPHGTIDRRELSDRVEHSRWHLALVGEAHREVRWYADDPWCRVAEQPRTRQLRIGDDHVIDQEIAEVGVLPAIALLCFPRLTAGPTSSFELRLLLDGEL